jgi:hypothetical protein
MLALPRSVAAEHADDPVDRFARLVVDIVDLAGAPVDPALIEPVALLLNTEGHLDLPNVTFGSNYDLDVRSRELERGYVRAIDSGWLRLRSGQVEANPRFTSVTRSPDAAKLARYLFAAARDQLMSKARHHLLRAAPA